METYGSLTLSWAHSFAGRWINFISTDTLVYGGEGNMINVIRSNGEHCHSKTSLGAGIGPVICSSANNIMAYSESTLKPKIFIVKFPSFDVISTLEGGAVMGYNCLAFSSDGNYIASLSSLPDFHLTVWSCATGVLIADTEVAHGSTQVSFNPINWKQLCVLGDNHVTLYLLEQCGPLTQLTPMEIPLPTRNGFVGCTIQPPRSPPKKRYSQVPALDSRPTTAVNQPPTDLSTILYSSSYEDIGDKDVPVVPQSHCWTYNSVLYCGCKEGQMFSIDVDIGSSHLLINPVSMIDEPDGGDVDSIVMPIIPEELSQVENQPVRSPLVGVKPPTVVGSDTLLVDTEDTSTTKSKNLPGKGDYSTMTFISKLGLFTAGENGIMYCIDVKNNQVSEGKASLNVSLPVNHLASSLDNAKLVVATETGSAFIVETDGLSNTVPLLEQDQTNFVGIDCTVDGKYAVSCKASGRVQVWSLENATVVSTICLMEECCSITCLPMCSAIAIGTKSGYLLMVSLLQPDSPALVNKQRLYYTALSNICCDTGGKCLALASSNNDVLIVSGKPSEDFKVLGHTTLAGYAQSISVQVEASIITVCVATSETTDGHINQLLLFSLPSPIKDESYEDHTRKFRDESINKKIIALHDVVTTFVLATGCVGYGLLASTKELAKFSISSDKEITAEAVYPGHQLKGGCLSLSPHQKWLLCAAPDGVVSVRVVASPDRYITITPHHYRCGGCQHACFSADGQRIVTVGDDRTITCWEWSFSSHGKQKGILAAEFAEKKLSALAPSIEKQNEALATYSVVDITQKMNWDREPSQDDEKTWLEKVIEEAKREDDKKYTAVQDSLRSEIQQLRDKVLNLIKTNETLPDIEKLDRSEFILDLEEHQKHQNEEADLIAKVREEVNMEILAQMYLRELIKQECWDSMTVKGKVLKAFQLRIEVSNYPLQKRPQQEMQQLNRVIQLRQVEMTEVKTRSSYIPKIQATTQHSKIDDEYADDDLGADSTQQEEGDKDPEAFVGSRGSQYGGESTMLYDQFQLHSSQKKNHQLILLKDCVFRIKEKFNQEFEEVFQGKVSEIQHIREKNVRIKKIINDLKLTDEKVYEPELDEDEQPESLLTVRDEEVTVEKYYSPEEKQKMEEAARAEEERRKAELGDNPRERALNMMMGGRLEASAEEDLFKDFPRPEFMNKEPAEMTEDEIRLAREFEKKEAAFLEEREKLKKVLEGELKKLQASIEQSMQSFDDRLVKLFKLKLRTELAINQEELKILRLAASLLTEEEVNHKEELLNQKLVEYKNQKVQLNNAISVAKKQVEDFKRDYEYAVVDDKDLDRAFRKDFSDCEPYIDVLYKAFRKRPRGQRIKVGDSGYSLPGGQDHRSFLMAQFSHPGDIMAEYDSPSHMPDGVTNNMWERLVAARRKKVENEHKVKAMALQLAEMQSFLQNRTAEDEYIQQQIQDTFKELSKLREDRNQFALNLEIQLLLRQGQVELEPGQLVPDFIQSVLLHRGIIEQLNSQIKTLGEAKLSSMNECKEFKRGIHMLDWEHEKLKMEADDLMVRTKEIQMLHVTKELQQWLIDEEQGGAKSRNTVDVLEKTLEINNQMHAKMMRHQQRTLKKLQNSATEKKEENQDLDKQLKDLQVSVIERQQIDDLAGISQAEAGAKERMHNIIIRKKLVQAAKAQAQEIAILRAEVERLRMRTFPALVQAGN